MRSVKYDGCIVFENGDVIGVSGKKLKPAFNKDGYPTAKFGSRTRTIHRVLYECFKGGIPKGLEIDHIDGDRTNNSLDNLEAVTHKENIRRAALKGSYKNNPLRQGQKHGRAILDDMQVLTIRTMAKKEPNGMGDGWSHVELAKLYGVSATRIYGIRSNREWKHLPCAD